MPKGIRGSAKAKQEQKKGAAPAKKGKDYSHITPDKDETGIPYEKPILPGTEPVDRLAPGIGVAGSPSALKGVASSYSVETPPSPSEVPEDKQEYTFLFEIEPSIGACYNVVVTRSDGKLQTIRCENEAEAQKWCNEQQSVLLKAKQERDQLKAEIEAQVVPIVTPTQVIDLQIPATEIPVTPAKTFLPTPPGLAKIHEPRENPAPVHEGDLILKAYTSKKSVHIIPELQEIVLKFLGNEEVDGFCLSEEEGLVIVTHPSARKARFWLTPQNKPIMTRC